MKWIFRTLATALLGAVFLVPPVARADSKVKDLNEALQIFSSNQVYVIMGDGTVDRRVTLSNVLNSVLVFPNWPQYAPSNSVLMNLIANPGTTVTNANGTQFSIVNGTLYIIAGARFTNTTTIGNIQLGDAGETATTTSSNTFRFRGTGHFHSSAFIQDSAVTGDAVMYLTAGRQIFTLSTVSSTELGYLDGVTSAIQTQLDAKTGTNMVTSSHGTLVLTNNFINHWHAGVPGPVASTNWLYATNGDSQYYNLFSHTNIQYVPLSGSDASNHVGVAVKFTQNSTGGYYPTNAITGQPIVINTNPLASTIVYFSFSNGATSCAPSISFTASPLANGSFWIYDLASGNWTNVTSSGSGGVARTNAPTIFAGILTGDTVLQRGTNVQALSYEVATLLIPTNNAASNITVNLSQTNRLEIWLTNNATFTNWVGAPDYGSSDTVLWLRPQLIPRGINWGNLGLANPGYSVAIGTNANNLLWTTLTNAKLYELTIRRVRTNLFPALVLIE